MLKVLSVTASVLCAATSGVAVAHADRAEPVPIYGFYNAFLDHSQQTFNGQPQTSDPSTQLGQFTTACDAKGCVAHWLRVTELSENPNAPSLYDYTWNDDRWESTSEYPFHCNGGGQANSTRSDFLVPAPGGGFSGERTFVVGAPGCPGDGPGTYWLPISLTPTDN
ncbi:MAG TPA: hypothetical protein VFB19_18990 [Mycobacterium sp.]|nr:hypothetical protein [Mycobacterium sp.]